MARLLPGALQGAVPRDHDLVTAVRRGEDSAFEKLFSRYRGRIRSYVSGILADGDRAEDITQEVFISALRRLRNTERPIAFKPWIYQIAKNACLDELRRTRRNLEVPLEQEREWTEGEDDLASRGPSPDDVIESKQQLEDLRSAFRGVFGAPPPDPGPPGARGSFLPRDRAAAPDVAPDGREHTVPSPAPAGRGIRRADQRTALRANPSADRRLGGPHSPAPRGARPASAGRPPGPLSAVPAPCPRGAESRPAAGARRGFAGRGVTAARAPGFAVPVEY